MLFAALCCEGEGLARPDVDMAESRIEQIDDLSKILSASHNLSPHSDRIKSKQPSNTVPYCWVLYVLLVFDMAAVVIQMAMIGLGLG